MSIDREKIAYQCSIDIKYAMLYHPFIFIYKKNVNIVAFFIVV